MERPTQKYDPRLLGLGLVAGAALGAVWINSKQRQYARHGAPSLINWERVGGMARQIVREEDVASGWHEQWKEYYQGMVARCYPVITSEIGRELPVPLDKIDAFTRNEWIDANIANFKLLFGPIESISAKSARPGQSRYPADRRPQPDTPEQRGGCAARLSCAPRSRPVRSVAAR